jgi:N-acetylmuramoyl-L-alanine amidase
MLLRGALRQVLKEVLACALLLPCAGCQHRNEQERTDKKVLADAAAALERISRDPRNGIPDSVLNAAKCVITVPSLPQKQGQINARGVASCREASEWRTPVPITFSGRSGRQTPDTLVVLVLTDKRASTLREGDMEIRTPQAKAPLVSDTPLVTQFDLAADHMTYGLLDTGMLVSSEVRGSFHAQGSSPVLRHGTAKYEAALQSFVNTIMPTGIVIHHTALIASKRLPRGEKDVDEYHQQRGFEIYCFGQVYHVAYHYLILPDGTVQNGRPERCEGAHARGYNSYLGISIIGDFSSRDNSKPKDTPEKPTAKQLKALVELCRMLRQRYNIPLQHVVRHSDIASTDCPGDRFPFDQFLRHLQGRESSVPEK